MLMPDTRTGVSSHPKVMTLTIVSTATRVRVRRGLRPRVMRRSHDTGEKYNDRGPGSGVRGPGSGVRGPGSGVRGPGSEVATTGPPAPGLPDPGPPDPR